ncbi:hypothetical protein [Emticicia agri]|uniref:Glycosyltransferase RgtA/B/C/D-like domain-containing protein n=1 Tax=Emticicia agri TaxID=2492393 RepID=A0A4Q5LW94_9BACT|nr:hypothetical protein [Emticicia agri]RYU93865.1 hypothetical protein EWM59_19690 [Emticicia agri]
MALIFTTLSRLQKFAILIGIIPVLFYCYVIFNFSSNVPFYDDFFWGFDYIETYIQKDSVLDKIRMLLMQHNQHRFIYFRAVLLELFQLEGNLNFRHLILVGNISLFGIFAVYAFAFRRIAISWVYFLPVPFLMFQYQFMYNSIVSYDVPNMSVIFLAILTFYLACFVTPKRSYWLWIVGFFATFSNGNGIVVFFVAIILLLLQQRFRQAIYTAIVYALSLAIYFNGFQMNSGEATLNGNTFLYAFRFLGAAFFTDINSVSVALSIIAVTGIVIYFIYFFVNLIKTKFKPVENKVLLFCLGVFLFLACTAMMTAIVRAIHKVEIPDWYKNYSILFITTIYLFLINFKVNEYLQGAILGMFIWYGVGIWYSSAEKNLISYQYMKSTFEADVVNFRRYQYWSFLTAQEGVQFYERHNQQTNEFIRKGWYVLPETPLSNQVFDKRKSEKTTFIIEKSAEHYATIIKYTPKNPNDNDRIYKERYGFIVNDSTNRKYFFGATPTFNGIRGVIKYKSLFYDRVGFGVKYEYFKNAIPAGDYRVGMVFIDANKRAEWKISDQTIRVDNY